MLEATAMENHLLIPLDSCERVLIEAILYRCRSYRKRALDPLGQGPSCTMVLRSSTP